MLGTLIAIAISLAASILLAPLVLEAMTRYAAWLLSGGGVLHTTGAFRFLFVTMTPLSFDMRDLSATATLIEIVVCALLIVVVSLLRVLAAPLRFFIITNLWILGGAAVFLYLRGHVGYPATEFSLLILETALVMWLVAPVFMGIVSLLFPLRFIDRVFLIVVPVIFDMILSIVRYGAFVMIAAYAGPTTMTPLYLLYGPLVDSVALIAFFSYAMVRLARQIDLREGVWGWL